MVNLIKTVEKFKNDPSTSKEGVKDLKRKLNEYKHKCKLANSTIAKICDKFGFGPGGPESEQQTDEMRNMVGEELAAMLEENRRLAALGGV